MSVVHHSLSCERVWRGGKGRRKWSVRKRKEGKDGGKRERWKWVEGENVSMYVYVCKKRKREERERERSSEKNNFVHRLCVQ